MKVMVLVKATAASEAGELPSETLLAEMGRYNEELVKAGIMLAGEGLHPTARGKRIHFSGASRTVIDGPFAETREQIAGFWIWQVESMEQAVEWLKRCPNPMPLDSEVDIRPIFEAADFGEILTPELREQEASLRAQTLGLGGVRFEHNPERRLVGQAARYSLETRARIADHWHAFVPRIAEIPGPVSPVCYGVTWNAGADCTFDYLTGVETSPDAPVPADFQSLILPAGRYAVFTYEGHISQLDAAIDTIWQKWAPDCGLKLAGTACFERYSEEFDPEVGRGGIEFWVPLAAM